jgi:membrane-bound lytic murein transglycosylase D
MTNSLRLFTLALSLVLSVWGCSSGSKKGPSTGPADADDLRQMSLEADSAAALFDFGDVEAFVAVRDSLRSTLESMAESYPEIRETPEFQQLLASLAELDSFASFSESPREHMAPVDSLALALEDWPDTAVTHVEKAVPGDSLFPYMEDDRIEFWVRYFTGPGRDYFARTLYRMELHRPVVERILDDQDLPHELIAIPMIESGFVMKARSRARAVGPWQFIAGTARLYGLRMDWWYDERRDIIASTYAATNYLKDLYGIWEDWPLALAAYNCGEYRVARAIAHDKTTDFWELKLPKQTERYVPKFLAALYILRDPAKYGFTIPEVEPVTFDEVPITDATDLQLVAQCAGTTVDVLQDLNPALRRWATPPKMEVNIKVPEGSGERCIAELAKIPPEERITLRKHRIRKGETLSSIARKYDTSVSALKSVNGIRNAHRIRAGHYLVVPVQGVYAEAASSKPEYMTTRRNIDRAAMDKYAERYAPPKGYKHVVYRVKSGDTLGEIAEWFHTRASKIRSWNNLRYRSYIYPGQKLNIYVPESFDTSQIARVTMRIPDEKDYVRQHYTVKKGDTIYSISRMFDVNMSDVMAWNSKTTSRIYPGQRLAIYKPRSN